MRTIKPEPKDCIVFLGTLMLINPDVYVSVTEHRNPMRTKTYHQWKWKETAIFKLVIY